MRNIYQHRGKSERRPKDIFGRIAAAKHWKDSNEFRSAVAEHTDIPTLKQTCPLGFRPFAEKLEAAFGPRWVGSKDSITVRPTLPCWLLLSDLGGKRLGSEAYAQTT